MSEQPWADQLCAGDLALAVFRNPGRYVDLLRGKGFLPSDCIAVIKLALDAARHRDEGFPDEHHGAALFFVEHVLLSEWSDHYRVLGLTAAATSEEIREHYRLMMAVFHPDRSGWIAGDREDLAARINLAYQLLRNPGKRAGYDLDRKGHDRAQGAAAPVSSASGAHAHAVARARPARQGVPPLPLLAHFPVFVQRHVPQFVLGVVALIGFVIVLAALVSRPTPGAIGAPARAVAVSTGVAASPESLQEPLQDAIEDSTASADAGTVVPIRAAEPSPGSAPLATERLSSQDAQSADRENALPVARAARDTTPSAAEGRPFGGAPELQVSPVARVSVPEVLREEHKPEPLRRTADAVPATPGAALREQTAMPEKDTSSAVEPAVMTPPVQKAAAPQHSKAREEATVVPPEQERKDKTAEQGDVARAGLAGPSHPVAASLPAAGNETPMRDVPSSGLTLDAAKDTLGRFRGAYGNGDIRAFMALFDRDASSNSGGLSKIRKDYESLFRNTLSREFGFHELRWSVNGQEAVAEGGFVVRVRAPGSEGESLHVGKVRIVFIKADDEALIKGLFHEVAR